MKKWKELDGEKKFAVLKVVYTICPFVGIFCGAPFLFIFVWEPWVRVVLALGVAVFIAVAAIIFVSVNEPYCPHCGAKLSVMTRWVVYRSCPYCGEKFDEPM